MAKLFYRPEYGLIAVRTDEDMSEREDHMEVTPEQALAIANTQIAYALNSIAEELNQVAGQLGGRK
jgi:hypothetical protein